MQKCPWKILWLTIIMLRSAASTDNAEDNSAGLPNAMALVIEKGCNFEQGTCGWTFRQNWTRTSDELGNHYMQGVASFPRSTSNLMSPAIQNTGFQYTLHFRYNILPTAATSYDNCTLRVFLLTSSGSSEVWHAKSGTSSLFSNSTLIIHSSEGQHWIAFEGNQSYPSHWQCVFQVDDTQFSPSTTTSTNSRPPAIRTSPATSSPGLTTGASSVAPVTGQEDDMETGSLAGIVCGTIAVIIIAVIFIIAMVLLWKRGRGIRIWIFSRTSDKGQNTANVQQVHVNPTFTNEEQQSADTCVRDRPPAHICTEQPSAGSSIGGLPLAKALTKAPTQLQPRAPQDTPYYCNIQDLCQSPIYENASRLGWPPSASLPGTSSSGDPPAKREDYEALRMKSPVHDYTRLNISQNSTRVARKDESSRRKAEEAAKSVDEDCANDLPDYLELF